MIREEAELICSIYCNQPDLRNLVADHVLLSARNVVVTPHSAFNAHEASDRIKATTIANIKAFVRGEPTNVVTAGLGCGKAAMGRPQRRG